MKKVPHIIWVCPDSKSFFRSKGEVRCRPGSVIPKLAEHGLRINILIPDDSALLPKTKLSASRISKHVIRLSQNYPVEIIKLTRGAISPGIYMVRMPDMEPALKNAVLAKSAIALARQLNRPVDIFHLFGWEASLVPLFLEMEKNGGALFSETRTFLNVSSLFDQGNFAPGILNYLSIPKELFHPDGIEFYGKVSYLKTGLIFSDGVGVIEDGLSHRAPRRNENGLEGVLDKLIFKLRRWASDRSLRSHLEAYSELLNQKKAAPLLPHLLKKLHSSEDEANRYIESWGPLPPERYHVNGISFVFQSPFKAYVFWEWTHPVCADYGLMLEDIKSGNRRLLSRKLREWGDYWVDVEPGASYIAELLGWTSSGQMRVLLRSRPLKIPRVDPSENTDAVFIDVKNRKRFSVAASNDWETLGRRRGGGTSAWEWLFPGLPSSLRKAKLK